MKKILVMLLALIMVFSVVACNPGEQGGTPDPGKTQKPGEATPEPEKYDNQIIIGSTTESQGNFVDGWGNSAIDAYVKQLLNGYSTVVWTRENTFIVDEKVTVKEFKEEANADGSKTYTFTINDNLTYNNGDPIKAEDYVASLLLGANHLYSSYARADAKAAAVAGGDKDAKKYLEEYPNALECEVLVGEMLVGYEDYASNKTNKFAGVKLIDEYTFSVTVKADELPYRYDLTVAMVSPMSLKVHAPSATIKADEDGTAMIEGVDGAELIDIYLDDTDGLRYKPTVTSGPYQFTSFDKDTRTIVIDRNEKYLGTYDEVKPSIDRLIIRLTQEATEIDELKTGSVDLLAGLAGGTTINAGLDLVDDGIVSKANYPRYGYGKIAFSCNFSPTQFVEVRQAIAYCLDRNEFIRQFSQGYAVLVHGNYGASMKEYIDNKDVIDAELNQYAYNIDKAKEVLIAGGWTLNEKGEPFVEGTDEIRYKDVDGELMPLIIKWASSDNEVAKLLSTMLPSEIAKVGMKIEATAMDFSILLQHYYQEGLSGDDLEYSMFNMGTGFSEIQAMWYYFDPAYNGAYNTNFIDDPELTAIVKEMKGIPMDDEDTWNAKWLEFQKRWNYLLPDIPLYSDDYHDFFHKKLENYNPDSAWGWQYDIVYANIAGHGN